jgi:hypothetical protein
MLDKIINEFDLKLVWEVDGVSVWRNDELNIQFINPHSGTKFKYCLRADFPETLDRWSVCLFEEDFEENEFDSTFDKLKDFVKNKNKIIKEERGY